MERERENCTVCVTGGGGYIGSWLVRDLLLNGYYVNATLRDPGNESKTRHILSLPGATERLTLFKADINEPGSFESAVHGCDFVVHVATPMDYTKDPEIGVIQATVSGTLNILRACTKAKSVRRVIYTSSITAASPLKDNGEFRDRVDESCWTNVDLIRREKPLFWMYYVAKTLAEQATLQYGSDHGIEVVTIAPSLVVGPFLTPTIPVSVAEILTPITGNEQFYGYLRELRDIMGSVVLVHIEDLCRAHIFLMEHPSVKGRYICSSEALSLHEMGDFCHKRYPQFGRPDSFLFGHLLNTKTMAEQNSTMGDQELLNALFEMLRNRQAKDNSTMLHEGISKGIPTPSMPLSTSGIMSEDVSRNTPSMQFIGTEDHFMPSTSRSKDHNIPSTSIRDVSRIPTELNLPTPDRTTHQFRNNPSNMGSVRVLPPTPEQVSWRSLIESQSQILGLLPDTLENAEAREKISKQIQLWETALVESAGLPSDQPENNDTVANVPIGDSISTSKTATVSSVTTRGMQEVTILLTSEGNVLKDEKGIKFFHFIFRRAEQLFGNTIQVDWRKQANNKKNELFADVIKSFGNPGFNKEVILDIARKYIHSKRDNLRSKLTKDLRYPRPAWITDQLVWDELMKDAKFKRKVHNNPNYRPSARSGGKRRLRDTTKATQARVSSIGSHKLGSGGYNSIRGGMVHQFEKEASEEDLKYALLHGSQGLRQRMLDRGEKLITGHEFEEAQQTNSSGEVSSSEHEEELEAPVELCVAHNESILSCGPQQETIPEIQQMADKNNEEGLQCDDQSLSRIRILPRRKRTQRKRMDSNIP